MCLLIHWRTYYKLHALVCSMWALEHSLRVPWWLPLRYCGLAALADSFWRKDCTCQCVNTTLLQPCVPRRNKAPSASHLQFQRGVMQSPRLVPPCHHDDMHIHVPLHVQWRARRYSQRPDRVAPRLGASARAQSELTFHSVTTVTSLHHSQPVKATLRCTWKYR